MCLPTWADVVAYEEADPRVISRLQTGYPRFFIHPLTERLFAQAAARFAGPDEFCHVYPSLSQPRGDVWSGWGVGADRWAASPPGPRRDRG